MELIKWLLIIFVGTPIVMLPFYAAYLWLLGRADEHDSRKSQARDTSMLGNVPDARLEKTEHLAAQSTHEDRLTIMGSGDKYVATPRSEAGRAQQSGVMRVRIRESSENILNPSKIVVTESDTPSPDAAVLEGGVRRKMFVYDDRPLDGIISNHGFYLDLLDHDITLRSVSTGTSWSSRGKTDIPVSYRGMPIGFINFENIPELKKAAQKSRVQIKAVWGGGIVSNVMRITILAPTKQKIVDAAMGILGPDSSVRG